MPLPTYGDVPLAVAALNALLPDASHALPALQRLLAQGGAGGGGGGGAWAGGVAPHCTLQRVLLAGMGACALRVVAAAEGGRGGSGALADGEARRLLGLGAHKLAAQVCCMRV